MRHSPARDASRIASVSAVAPVGEALGLTLETVGTFNP